MQSRLKWLYPGMRVKRWLLLVGIGVIMISVGTSMSVGVEVFDLLQDLFVRPIAHAFGALPQEASLPLGVAVILAGVFCVGVGIRQTINSLIQIFLPENSHRLPDIVFERRQLKRGPRIVVVGGGTGLSTLLRGLKSYSSNLTAVVTTADDGGSSGRLRSELGIPPPGDIRNTLVALADTEPLMERLFQYRFESGDGLKGHSFGNLFIAALSAVTGDFEAAVRESSKVLAIRGRVLPSTVETVTLRAEYADGSTVTGESAIPSEGKEIRRVSLWPEDVSPVDEALRSIREADAAILGPGSLYTSILPNLLVRGVGDAIKESSATKIYVCNVMTQPGETDGYSASDHVRALLEHVRAPGVVEYALVNSATVAPQTAKRYELEGAYPVDPDVERLRALGVTPVATDLIDDANLARHHPEKLAESLIEIIGRTHPNLKWQAQGVANGVSQQP